MDLDSRQLRYVVQLAADLNFTRAAETLHVAQQTLSESIKMLERQLGVQLFERSPQRVELTAAGAVFVAHAQDLIDRVASTITATHAEARSQAGTLLVGTPDWSVGIELFRASIESHCAVAGAPSVVVDPTPWIHHIRAVVEHRLDLGVTFVTGSDDLPDGLAATPLVADDAGWALVAPDHVLADRDLLAVADLGDFPILMIERVDHPVLHDRLMSQLRDAGVEPQLPDHNPGSFATALAHSMASSAVVLVSASMAANPPGQMKAVRIEGLDVGLRLAAITRVDDERCQTLLDALVKTARTYLR